MRQPWSGRDAGTRWRRAPHRALEPRTRLPEQGRAGDKALPLSCRRDAPNPGPEDTVILLRDAQSEAVEAWVTSHHSPDPFPGQGWPVPKGCWALRGGTAFLSRPQQGSPHSPCGQKEWLGMEGGTMQGGTSQVSSAGGPCCHSPCPQGTHPVMQTACGEPGGTAASSAAASPSAPCGWHSACCQQ